MAGNVREWVWNAIGDKRYALGGAWGEPPYMYGGVYEARSPFDRSPANGLRCARYAAPPDAPLLAPVDLSFKRAGLVPATDDVFEIDRGIYSYAHGELKAAVEKVDDSSPHWRREKVSFAAAYGGERTRAWESQGNHGQIARE